MNVYNELAVRAGFTHAGDIEWTYSSRRVEKAGRVLVFDAT